MFTALLMALAAFMADLTIATPDTWPDPTEVRWELEETAEVESFPGEVY